MDDLGRRSRTLQRQYVLGLQCNAATMRVTYGLSAWYEPLLMTMRDEDCIDNNG